MGIPFKPSDVIPATFGQGGNAAPVLHDLLTRVQALEGNSGAQAQSAWFIDPVNGHDSNAGTSSGAPLKTVAALYALWGTNNPTVSQNTIVQFLNSQPDNSDPVFTPAARVNAVSLTYKGQATQVATGTFGAVVAKNRATPQLWTANLGQAVAAFVGMRLVDVNTGAIMIILADLGSNVAELSQPLAPTATAGYGTINAELDTLALGHAYKIFSLTNVAVVGIGAVPLTFNASFTNGVLLQDLNVFDVNGTDLNDCYLGPYAGMIECTSNRDLVGTQFAQDLPSFLHNCYFPRIFGNQTIYGGACTLQASAIGNITSQFAGVWDDDFAALGGGILLTGGVALGLVYLGNSSTLENSSIAQATAGGILWGPGRLDHRHGGKTYYGAQTSATAFFLLTGGINLNGSANGNSISYSANVGTIHNAISITAAHLDAAAGAAGFGGLAWDPISGSLISNSVP